MMIHTPNKENSPSSSLQLESLEPRVLLSTVPLAEEVAFNVRVNSDTGGASQNSPALAVNPDDPLHLVGVCNDWRLEQGYPNLAFLSSFDGGQSWTDGLVTDPDVTNPSIGFQTDPSITAYRDGVFYAGMLSFYGPSVSDAVAVGVARSDDGGLTWTGPVTIVSSSSVILDNPDVFVDATGSDHDGNVYMAWRQESEESETEAVMFSRSTDAGQSWSSPIQVNDIAIGEGATVRVGPNGEVYVAYLGQTTRAEDAIILHQSSDGGQTFSEARIVSEVTEIDDPLLPAMFKTNSFPAMTVDVSDNAATRGNVYFAWADARWGDADILSVRSYNSGQTFSEPVRINDDGLDGVNQFFPSITVDQDTSDVVVDWYDQRNDSGTDFDLYVSSSDDGGLIWGDNIRVSNVTSTPGVDGFSGTYIGDHVAVAAAEGSIYPMWTDMRLGEADIYAAAVTVPQPEGAVLRITDTVGKTNDLQMPFPDTFVDGAGGVFRTGTVTLTNVGTETVTVSDIGLIAQTAFSLPDLPELPLTLEAGQNETFDVRFDPTEDATYIDSITVASDDPDNPVQIVSLSGSGFDQSQSDRAVLTNDLDSDDPRYFEVILGPGGETYNFTSVHLGDVSTVYEYLSFLNVNTAIGSQNVFQLGDYGTNPVQTGVGEATSTVTIPLATGGVVTIAVTSAIPAGETSLYTTYQLTSTGDVDFRDDLFWQYIDTQIQDTGDDILLVDGSVGEGNLQLTTVDGGLNLSNTLVPGELFPGAAATGFAADKFPDLWFDLISGGLNVPPEGDIDTTDLPPGFFPGYGDGYGPGIVTTAIEYSFNDTSSAIIETVLGVNEQFGKLQVTDTVFPYQDQYVPFRDTLNDGAEGETREQTVTLTNVGEGTLRILDVSLETGTYFSLQNAPDDTENLLPGKSLDMTVIFDPRLNATFEDKIIIETNDLSRPTVSIPLLGTGFTGRDLEVYAYVLPGPPTEPDNLDLIDFGPVFFGLTAQGETILENNGTVDLTISNITVDDPQFTVSQPELPVTLNPDETLTLDVSYTPTFAGETEAYLTITSNDSDDSPYVVVLRAEGMLADIEILDAAGQVVEVPGPMDFGYVGPDETHELTYQIHSIGNMPLTLEGLELAMRDPFGLDPILDPDDPADDVVLEPGDLYDFTLTFDVPCAGTFTDTLTVTVTSTDPDEGELLYDVEARGWAGHIQVSTNDLDFGTQTVGIPNTPDKTFTITNAGESDLTISHITVSRPFMLEAAGQAPLNYGYYVVEDSDLKDIVIPGGDELVVTVNFVPTVATTITDTIHIQHNDPAEPVITVDVFGIGVTHGGGGPIWTGGGGGNGNGNDDGNGGGGNGNGGGGNGSSSASSRVQVKLAGPGFAHVNTVDGNPDGDVESIILFGTTEKSRLRINAREGLASVGRIVAPSGLKSIKAPDVVLTGTGIELDGSLGLLVLDGISADADVIIHGNLKTAKLDGELAGDLLVDGDIRTVKTKGTLTGTVRAGGDLRTLKASSALNAMVTAAGDIKTVKIKYDFRDTSVFAGFDLGGDGLIDTDDDLLAPGEINKVRIGGTYAASVIAAGVRPTVNLFYDPPVSASDGRLGNISMGNINTDNNGVRFGLFAARSIGKVKVNSQRLSAGAALDDFLARIA